MVIYQKMAHQFNNQSNSQPGNNQQGNPPSNKEVNKKVICYHQCQVYLVKKKPLDVKLVTNLKSDVDSLSTDIVININIENEDANEICKNLSNNLNCIGNFIVFINI